MRKQILAVTTVIALTIAAATSAMAFDHKAGHTGRHVKAHHAAGLHGYAAKRGRLAGAGNPERWNHGNDRGGFIDLGPLGFTAACGSPSYKGRYCGQGYSVSGWTY